MAHVVESAIIFRSAVDRASSPRRGLKALLMYRASSACPGARVQSLLLFQGSCS